MASRLEPRGNASWYTGKGACPGIFASPRVRAGLSDGSEACTSIIKPATAIRAYPAKLKPLTDAPLQRACDRPENGIAGTSRTLTGHAAVRPTMQRQRPSRVVPQCRGNRWPVRPCRVRVSGRARRRERRPAQPSQGHQSARLPPGFERSRPATRPDVRANQPCACRASAEGSNL
jgi:hypothetical protein